MKSKEERIRDILSLLSPIKEKNLVIEIYEEKENVPVLIDKWVTETKTDESDAILKITVIPSPVPLSYSEDEVCDSLK
jgi:hypothetical protein